MNHLASLLDETHDPALRSWVSSAQDAGTDFPIQNLPFGRFRLRTESADAGAYRLGLAIGNQVLDLRRAVEHLKGAKLLNPAWELLAKGDLNGFMALAPAIRRAVRVALSRALRDGSALQDQLASALVTASDVQMALPCHIQDYTDFYTGIHHATTVGKLFRPDNPLLPNYKWVPIGYHGRSSSIVVSDTPVVRPLGQLAGTDGVPRLAPCQRLDFELELAAFVAAGNPMGQPIGIEEAENHLFGVCLLNDWSARDIQTWEYQPLGPFLAKNFASSISPWVVTMEALAPYRQAFSHPEGDPQPLPYLDSERNRQTGAFNIQMEVLLQTAQMRQQSQAAVKISQSNFAQSAYWTLAQLVTHHTVSGCNLQSGDLLGTGTLSGPTPEQAGSLLELSKGGKQAHTLPNGEQRSFLQDGDTLVLRAYCEQQGCARIGFGEVSGTVMSAPVISQ